MPIPRRSKGDHLLHADVVDSKSKAGVWMGEKANFKADQASISEALKLRDGYREVVVRCRSDSGRWSIDGFPEVLPHFRVASLQRRIE
ncbi:hypothetical protein ACT1U9_04005 [Streptomyces sp. BR1]|uniref:hypothetical protein n=1 Tax=Streptomyces sp. BR1 TaxID=1592323 RepID=UPI00402B0886